MGALEVKERVLGKSATLDKINNSCPKSMRKTWMNALTYFGRILKLSDFDIIFSGLPKYFDRFN